MDNFYVYTDKPDDFVGKCYYSLRHGRLSSVFSYDDAYLAGADNWNIDPNLMFTSGSQPSDHVFPGAFRDAAPDRWGRTLINHRLRKEALDEGLALRTPTEVDYLLGVSDLTRQGALRFSLARGGAFQHPSNDVPRLLELPKLLNSAEHIAGKDNDSAISYLLDAGSASLGGARPKASVRDGDKLLIAKFPHHHDEWDVIAWEWVSLQISAAAGVETPANRLVCVENKNVLLIERFDRCGDERVGYLSAMTLLNLDDGMRADYSEIVQKLHDVSNNLEHDLSELFRRILLSLQINNTDDHLRNHGVVRSGSGWRLSPVFDINPNPNSNAPRATSVLGMVENASAVGALFANAEDFGLTVSQAQKIAEEVRDAVGAWRKYAAVAGIPKSEQERFSPIFAK